MIKLFTLLTLMSCSQTFTGSNGITYTIKDKHIESKTTKLIEILSVKVVEDKHEECDWQTYATYRHVKYEITEAVYADIYQLRGGRAIESRHYEKETDKEIFSTKCR